MSQKFISREAIRRQTLPTIINALTAMGPLFKIRAHTDHVELIIMNRGHDMFLKFSDEDAAADEGYSISRGPVYDKVIPVCDDRSCIRGCGCGCVRDLGYVKPEAHLFMVHNIDKPACSAKHEATLVEIIDDDPPCTLKCTRVMVDQILNAYMASALSRAASD